MTICYPQSVRVSTRTDSRIYPHFKAESHKLLIFKLNQNALFIIHFF